jgi:hypothetical protein
MTFESPHFDRRRIWPAQKSCRVLGYALLLLVATISAQAQQLSVYTLAGSAGHSFADGTGGSAQFSSPQGIAFDNAGNAYVADTANNIIRQIAPGGVVSTLAGLVGVTGSNDGTNTAARFSQPTGVAVDSTGNIYVADSANDTIRKISPVGLVTTLAGLAGVSGSANGTGTNAQFNQPQGVAVDSSGFVYVADYGNHTIRKITPGGAVSTLAGYPGNFGSANGSGTNAQFYQPQGVAVDSLFNVYVADTANGTIRVITSGGAVSTLAGLAGNLGHADGLGTNAQFYAPQGVAVDGAGNVYVADTFNNMIRKVTSSGQVSTLAGLAGASGSSDGTNTVARFWAPAGVAAMGTNAVRLCVSDTANGTIRQVVVSGTNGVVSTLAGAASSGSADGSGTGARLNGPQALSVDGSGNVYVADTANNTVREITSGGAASTLAGLAGSAGSSDGTGANARFQGPQGLAVSSDTVYVADTGNGTIRTVTTGGQVNTLAGLAGNFGSVDGTGSAARFYGPQAMAADGSGNVYVADTWNDTIRKVTSAGVVTTIAGLAGNRGGSDGTNNGALFNTPMGVAVGGSGTLYVGDTYNHTVRQLTLVGTNWVASTIAGLAGVWGSADGTNSSARFFEPEGIVVDGSGNLYVMDAGNNTIRKVTPAGTNWVVNTVAGQAGIFGSSDGSGTNAQFNSPAGVAMDSSGNVYVADSINNTIRASLPITNNSPTIIDQPQSEALAPGSTALFSVVAAGSAPLTYQWSFDGTNIPGATAPAYILQNAQTNNAGFYAVTVSNQFGVAISSNALLSLNGPPFIAVQPESQTAVGGRTVTFSVAASGTQPLVYQWLFNGSAIAGANSSSFTISDVQVASQGSYSCLVTNSLGFAVSTAASLGVVALDAWGDDTWGEINTPTNCTGIIAIASGAWHSLALRADGTVLAWGDNVDGQCDVPAASANALAIAAGGYHGLAILANGAIIEWGDNTYGQSSPPPGLTNVLAIAAGTWHTLALKTDGTVVAWGDNSFGQTNVPAGLSNVIAIAAGGNHCLALSAAGQVTAWGQDTDAYGNYAGQSDVPANLTNAVAISAGDYHSLAVRGDGSVAAWGDNSSGQCTVPAGLAGAVAVAGGGAHSLALGSNGIVTAWGQNSNGQCNVPAGLTNAAAVAGGEADSLALLAGNMPEALLLHPAWNGGQFSAVIQTMYRNSYSLEFSSSPGSANWTALPAVTGNGALRLIADPAATAPQRFYRLQVTPSAPGGG